MRCANSRSSPLRRWPEHRGRPGRMRRWCWSGSGNGKRRAPRPCEELGEPSTAPCGASAVGPSWNPGS
eukprot:2769322-Lingulodinium_polyedra.AAC.1